MSIIVLVLGASYIDAAGTTVKMVTEFTKADADFVQGFRFRGDNGIPYLADGGVIGQVGGASVMTLGAHPIVREAIETGRFYRNGLGQVVFIVNEVGEDHPLYKKGARFADERGTFYTDSGSVNSRLWNKLDLTVEVDRDDMTDDEIAKIHDRSEANLKRLNRSTALATLLRRRVPFKLARHLPHNTFDRMFAATPVDFVMFKEVDAA